MLSFHRSNDFNAVGDEVRAVREARRRHRDRQLRQVRGDRRRRRGLARTGCSTNAMPRTGRIALVADAERGRQADRRLHRGEARPRTASWSGARRRRRSTTCAGSRRTCRATARCGSSGSGMRLMGLMLAGPRSRDGAGGADRPRRLGRRLPLHGPPRDGRGRRAGDGQPASATPAISATRSGSSPPICARSTAR